jgi:hypothetical protein
VSDGCHVNRPLAGPGYAGFMNIRRMIRGHRPMQAIDHDRAPRSAHVPYDTIREAIIAWDRMVYCRGARRWLA